MADRVLNRPPLPDPPKNSGESMFVVLNELWRNDDDEERLIEPKVLLVISNPIILETIGGQSAVGIALDECQVFDLIRDLADEFHQSTHKAGVMNAR
jgi:hypothetical protein